MMDEDKQNKENQNLEQNLAQNEGASEVESTEEAVNRGVEELTVENVMEDSFIRYSMSVIIDRALPDVRDGLKPVNRRILYAMQKNGWKAPHATVKSARIVGEVMGKYHPHGDSSIYDAMVNLAQPWKMRYTLVEGQGNFGSMDGDDPAAFSLHRGSYGQGGSRASLRY